MAAGAGTVYGGDINGGGEVAQLFENLETSVVFTNRYQVRAQGGDGDMLKTLLGALGGSDVDVELEMVFMGVADADGDVDLIQVMQGVDRVGWVSMLVLLAFALMTGTLMLVTQVAGRC